MLIHLLNDAEVNKNHRKTDRQKYPNMNIFPYENL